MKKSRDRLVEALGFTALGMTMSLILFWIVSLVGNKIGSLFFNGALITVSAAMIGVTIPALITLVKDIIEKRAKRKHIIEIGIEIDGKVITLRADNLENARQLLRKYNRLNPTLKTKDKDTIEDLSEPDDLKQDFPKEKVVG